MPRSEAIQELFSRTEELERLEREASDLLQTARDKHGHEGIQIDRDGKVVSLPESTLWYEVINLGYDTQAGRALRERHPQVFDAYEEQNKKADELREFTIREFGIDYNRIKLSDIFKVVEIVLEARTQQT